jgi:hypothetical protein
MKNLIYPGLLICMAATTAQAQFVTTQLSPETYQNMAETYNFRFMDEIRGGAVDGIGYKYSNYSSTFRFNIGTENHNFNDLTIHDGSLSREEAIGTLKSDLFPTENPAAIEYRILQNGSVLYEKDGTPNDSPYLPDLQQAELGVWYNNRMIHDLDFSVEPPLTNTFSGINIANWHDRIFINYYIRLTEDMDNGQLEFDLSIPQIYNQYDSNGDIYTFSDTNGFGFAIKGSSFAESLSVSGSESNGYVITVTGAEQNIESNTSYEVGLILQASNTDIADALEYLEEETTNLVAITAKQTLPDEEDLDVVYNEDEGYYFIEVIAHKQGLNSFSTIDVFENVELNITNSNNYAKRIRLCFENAGGSQNTGFTSTLMARDGGPLGAILQVSKKNNGGYEFHHAEEKWQREYTELIIPANTTLLLDYASIGARWGGVYAAHSHHLSIVGYTTGGLTWMQGTLGGFGETICHTPDLIGGSLVTDWRSFLVYDEGSGGQYGYNKNYGGLDFGRADSLSEDRIDFDKYGPCLTDTSFTYFALDKKVRTTVTFYLNRSDDFNRVYHRVKIEALDDVSADGFFFYSNGAGYNKAAITGAYYGNTTNVVGQFTMDGSSSEYSSEAIALEGEQPWLACIPADEFDAKGFVVREYAASFAGVSNNTPYVREYINDDTHARYQLVCPPDVTEFQAGDSVEFLVCSVIIPQDLDEYWGENAEFIEALTAQTNVWDLFLREAAENDVTLSSTTHQVNSTYPHTVTTVDDEAYVNVKGGTGYVPIIFENVSDIVRIPKLWREVDDMWERVDQSYVGNDFWQVYYNEGNENWDIIFNIDQDITESSAEVVSYYFGQSPPSDGSTPTAYGQDVTLNEDGATEITLTGSDPNGDSITYTIQTQPAYGELSEITALTNLTYTPDANFCGLDSFTFSVSDGVNDSYPATVLITVNSVNDAPVASAINAYVIEDGSVEITLSGTDSDGDSLSYTIVSQPEYGSLSGSCTNWTYTPDSGFSGSDLFAYTVSDGAVDSSLAPVNITVTSASEGTKAHWPMNDGSGTSISDVSGNGFDGTLTGGTWANGIDGGAIEFDGSVSSDSVSIPASAFNSVSNQISIAMWVNGDEELQPRNDSVFCAVDSSGSRLLNIHLPYTDSGVYWDAGDSDGYDRINQTASATNFAGQWNHWVFTKDADAGTMKIYLNGALWHSGTGNTAQIGSVATACFGSGVDGNYYEGALDDVRIYDYELDDEAILTLYSTYDNQNPVAYDMSVDVVGNGSVSFSLTAVDPEGTNLNYTVLTQPSFGDLNGSGSELTYSVDTDYDGADSFAFWVTDGVYTSNVATVSIQVDTSPSADDISTSVDEDGSVEITLAGADPEGSNLTYCVDSQPANGSLSGDAPDLTYSPDENYFGSDSFTYSVSDGLSTSAVATVAITIDSVNDTPIAVDQSIKVKKNDAVAITLSGTDIDNASLGYTVTINPANGSLSGTEPYLTYTPDTDFSGSDSFTFVVTDGSDESEPATVSIEVVDDDNQWITWNDAGSISSESDVSTNGTSLWAYSLGATGSNVINGVTFIGETNATGNANVTTDLAQMYTVFGNDKGSFSALSSAYQNILESAAYDSGENTTITLNGLTIDREYEVQFWINDSRNRSDMDSKPRSATISNTTFVVDYNTTGASTDDGLGQYIIGTFTAVGTTQDIELETVVIQLNAIQLRDVTSSASLDTYSVWVVGYGLSGSDSLYMADSDNDGINNLVEFALGMNPILADSDSKMSVATVNVEETNWIEVIHDRRSDYLEQGLSYLLIDSTNLVHSTTHTNAQDEILIGEAVGDYEPVTNRYEVDESALFIQLKVKM